MTDIIRMAQTGDEGGWRNLFAQYVDFYRSSVSEDVVAHTWSRILDPASAVSALVAERDSKIVGFCNYHFHETTWGKAPYCYLEDLFVDPAARGGGVAKKLILACEQAAKDKGASRIYWHTQEYNAPARSLYDTIMPRSSFIVYRRNF
jgi:GNAT superfamily N-acetyltransferase